MQTTKVRTAQCPEGMLLRVKLAEAGSGIKSFDASKETVLQQQCPVGSNSCTFDFSKFKEYKGQALRVEVWFGNGGCILQPSSASTCACITMDS